MAFGDDPISERKTPAEIPGVADVIQFAKWKAKECAHGHLEVDTINRRIMCLDCKREIEPFEAVVQVARETSDWHAKWEAMRTDYRNLAAYVPHLRAVRELESMWRGNRLPMCPHCKKGVTAEGLKRMGWVHQSYAEAMVAHATEIAPAAEVIKIDGPRNET